MPSFSTSTPSAKWLPHRGSGRRPGRRRFESRELSDQSAWSASAGRDHPVEQLFEGKVGSGGSGEGPASTTAGSAGLIWQMSPRSPARRILQDEKSFCAA